MSSQFDVVFGQQLCDVLATELGFVCNFMGEQGRIVASSERERIGSIHAIAARIMGGEIDEYGVSGDEAAESSTMREGVNMGIDLDGVRMASFSIAGPLDVVRPLARIVRFCVASLLRVRREETTSVLDRDSDASPGTRLADARADAEAVPVVPVTAGSAANLVELLSHASETIEHSLTRLRDAVENIDQGITMFDAELRLVVWNRRFLELIDMPQESVAFGLSLEAIIRHYATHAGYASAEVEELVTERMTVVRTRRSNQYEHQMPNGMILEMVDRPLPTGGFVTTYTDASLRRQAATALRAAYENAERMVESRTSELREFAELSSDWFWEQDAEFRFKQFSGHSTEKLRRNKSDFFGKRRWDMPISGVGARDLSEHIATCERHEPFRNFDYEIPGSDGVSQHYSVSGTPVFDERGQFAGYRGIGRNVTDLRKAELAIKSSERHLSQIVDGSSIPTFVIDAEHRVTHWNQACANLTGLDASQMVGSKDVWQAFYSAPRPTMADLVMLGTTDENVAGYYHQFIRSSLISGAIEAENFHPKLGAGGRWLYFTAAPLRNAEGEIVGALETVQDITERRREQQLLEERTEALQKAYSDMEQRVVERTAELSRQLGFLKQLIEAIPGPVFYMDAEERYLGCNSAFEAFIGRPASELIGKTSRQLSHAEQVDVQRATDRDLLDRSESLIYESAVRFASGETRDVMFHKAAFTLPEGRVGGLVGLMIDISERRRMEGNLRQAASVFESSAEGVVITAPDGSIIAVNRAFTEITGYGEGEVIGRNPRFLQSGRHGQNFYREMWGSISRDGRWKGEVWNRRKSGDIFPEWISIVAVRDNKGRMTNYVATFSDITQQKQSEERIEILAFSDPLTKLPNRRLLLDRLAHAIATSNRNNCRGALFFIDLDDFKDLNDTRGHDIGDLLLQQVAKRLAGCVSDGDTLGRFGGDEFVVVLENLGVNSLDASSQAEAVGVKILSALNQPYMLEEFSCHSTASIGITLFGGEHSSVDELLKQADLAMYRAKGAGRNRLRFFDPEMQTVVAARVAMESDLRQGLQKSQFVLHYQPQVDHIGRVTGAEALVRWNHPQRGIVSPAAFIPLAEETGLILPLGLWVLESACKQLSAWAMLPELAHVTVAVNVSAHQFRQHDFVDLVLASLDSCHADSAKLKLEITESLLLDDVEEIIAKMTALKARGVSFSLDDFGTGYSSLSYLKRLPLDQLKIDQSFVRDVLVDPNNAAIARTIVALAHSLGLAVIAEGVETEEQLLFLAGNGCHAYQGYLFSRPLPIEEFEEFVRRT
jgi:diguanylate cyclase (GGDEF)-like protein/PAS domain S-box-containing protein